MATTIARVAVTPGDGIGLEVTPAAVAVVDAALAQDDATIDWEWFPWGCEALSAVGPEI